MQQILHTITIQEPSIIIHILPAGCRAYKKLLFTPDTSVGRNANARNASDFPYVTRPAGNTGWPRGRGIIGTAKAKGA